MNKTKIFPRMELKSCLDCPFCTEEYESCKPDFFKCNNPISDVYNIATVFRVNRYKETGKLIPFPIGCPLRNKWERRKSK